MEGGKEEVEREGREGGWILRVQERKREGKNGMGCSSEAVVFGGERVQGETFARW